MELTLRLVRHGRTAWADAGRYCGATDIGLTDAGRAALAAAPPETAGFDSVVSSDLQRCRETAAILGIVPRFDSDLREFDFGDMEGSTWADLDPSIQTALGDYQSFVAPGGESVVDFDRRIDRALGRLRGDRHLLVTHGGVIQHLLWREQIDARVAPGGWIDLALSRR